MHTSELNCLVILVTLCLILWGTVKLFWKHCILYYHQQCMWIPVSPISFFHKLTLIRLFSGFSVKTTLDRSLVISKNLNPKSILSSYCVWPINSIWHIWLLIFLLLASSTPPPILLIFLSVSFVGSSFLLFQIGVLIGDLFNTIHMPAPKLISLRSLFFCTSEAYIQLPTWQPHQDI